MSQLREIDGMKVAFCEHESYFAGFTTPSMHSTAKATGANIVFLLGPGVKPEQITVDELRTALSAMNPTFTEDRGERVGGDHGN